MNKRYVELRKRLENQWVDRLFFIGGLKKIIISKDYVIFSPARKWYNSILQKDKWIMR